MRSALPSFFLRIASCGLFAAIVLLGPGCQQFKGTDHPTDRLRFPVGIAADPDGHHLYVVNSNFDLAFNGGNIVTLDVDTHTIVPGATVQTLSLGSSLAVREEAGQATGLYLTTREGNALTWVDITRDGDTPVLNCRQDAVPDGEAHVCGGPFVYGGVDSEATAGRDPFGVVVAPARGAAPARVYTNAFDGTVTVFDLKADGAPVFRQSLGVAAGGYGIQVHPLTGTIYTTTKALNAVFTVGLSEPPEVATSVADGTQSDLEVALNTAVVVQNQVTGRDYGRGLAFSRDGGLAFVAYRSPPSLLVIDTSVDVGGLPKNRLLDSVPLPAGPAAVAVAPSGPQGRDLVYVTLFNTDEVVAIDPLRFEVVARIPVGDGPFDITTITRPGLSRAYVTLFEDSSVGVIELDPDSPFYHQEIARIP